MNITEEFITQFAVNSSAITNGKNLVNKNNFTSLNISEDGSIIFGVCKGSGKSSYNCSLDFQEESNPIPRCSCPSRQIPCKHVIGLMFCYLYKKEFTKSELPEDIISKRQKIEKRKEKKEDVKPKTLTKTKANAIIKKCKLQLEGIIIGEKILNNIMLSGIHSIDKKSEAIYKGQINELGNYYISGIQEAFLELVSSCIEAQTEQRFSICISKISYTSMLLKKAKEYIQSKISDYNGYPNVTEVSKELMINSSIEEQIGHAWKLSELKEYGLYRENIELIQVAFNSYVDSVNFRYIDEGIWIIISTGEIYKTYNYRPFRAKNHIKEEDSFFSVLQANEAYIYPGEINSRIRWESYLHRDIDKKDLEKIKTYSNKDFSSIIKKVKSHIKSPLSNKNPIYSLKISDIKRNKNKDLAIFDEKGVGIPLKLEQFGFILDKLKEDEIKDQTLICSFIQDIEKNILYGVPIAIINNDNVLRLYY